MSPPRILVVDDNQELADNIAEILEAEGYPTAVAYDPPAALDAASRASFEVALLDVRLPGMDGVTLYGELRRSHPEATYVLMTAFTRDERLAEALDAGVQAVLAKPVPIDRLLELLPAPDEGLPALLLVEDDVDLASNLGDLLAEQGYAVESVRTLAAARERLAGPRPSAVVVDIRLPDGDGIALAEHLCRDRRLPVVVMTGFEPDRTSEAVRLACGDDAAFLSKPFDVGHLLRALEGIADRAAPGRPHH